MKTHSYGPDERGRHMVIVVCPRCDAQLMTGWRKAKLGETGRERAMRQAQQRLADHVCSTEDA